MSKQEKLLCPICQGTIKKIESDVPLIKCEKNVYKDGKNIGCSFFMNLSPKPLGGYIFSRDEVVKMIDGKSIMIGEIEAKYEKNTRFSPTLIFPEPEDF